MWNDLLSVLLNLMLPFRIKVFISLKNKNYWCWSVVILWKITVWFQPATYHKSTISKSPKTTARFFQVHLWGVAWLRKSNWNSNLVYVHRMPFSGSTASLRANCAFISTINRRTITSTSISPRWSTTLQEVEWKEPTCFPMSFRTCRQIPVTITTVAWRSHCVPMMPCSSSSKRPGNSRDLFFFLGTSIFFYLFINVMMS